MDVRLLILLMALLIITASANLVSANTGGTTCGTPATGMNCMTITFGEYGTCIDIGANNALDSTDICHDMSGCNTTHVGASCDDSGGTVGICVQTGALTGTCSNTAVSGEYGTGITGGTAVNFHDGNENQSCGASSEMMVCNSSTGLNPTGGDTCVDNSCMRPASGIVSLNCIDQTCSTGDVSGANVEGGCALSSSGWACDSNLASSGFIQDGQCAINAPATYGCATGSNHTCNASGGPSAGTLFAGGCGIGFQCADGDPCDATLTNGNYDKTYGTCSGTTCAVAANAVPNVTTPIFNDSFVNRIESIQANTTYSDVEGSTGTVYFEWFINGISKLIQTYSSVANNTVLRSNFTVGNYTDKDKVNVSVNATDGSGNSNKHNSLLLTIQDCKTFEIFNETNNRTMFDVNCIGDSQIAGDFSLWQRIVFKVGEYIESIKAGWTRVTGSLNVTSDLLVNRDANISGSLRVNGANITGLSSETYTGDVNGTGQAGRVAIWNSGNNITKNENLTFNLSTSRLGIGTSSPSQKLEVFGGHVNFTANATIASRFHIDQINSSTMRMWFG